MKRSLSALCLGTILLSILFSCTQKEQDTTAPEKKIDVSVVMLDQTSLEMTVGQEARLVATIVPENATVQTIQWQSSNESVATVHDGTVKAVKEGSAKIVAYADGKTAECNVTVTFIAVQGISLDKTELTLYDDDSYTLTATVTPQDATYPDIVWGSSDTAIATVDNGKVNGIHKGTATITAQTNGHSASCQVEVLASLKGLSFQDKESALFQGEEKSLTLVLEPEDATLRGEVVWTSSNDQVATVNQEGLVTAAGGGTATITAKADGEEATCTVTVTPNAPGMPVLTGHTFKRFTEGASGLCFSVDKDFLWGVDGSELFIISGLDGEMENITIESNTSGAGESGTNWDDTEGITIDPATGTLYFASENPSTVSKKASPYTEASTLLFTVEDENIFGQQGLEGIAWYKGDLYLGAQIHATLFRYSLDGQLLEKKQLWGDTPVTEIAGLYYDDQDDLLWICDSEARKLFVFDGEANQLKAVYSLAFAANPEAVVVDHQRHCVWIGDNCDGFYKLSFTGL